MAGSIAAAVAGTTAVAAYLDAKYHFSKDIKGIRDLQRTGRDYAEQVKQGRESCFYLLEKVASSQPQQQAIWSRTGCYNMQEVLDKSYQYAYFFLDLGIRPGQLVGFYMRNSPEYMFAWFGLLAIGCAPAPLNYNLIAEPLVHCLKVTKAQLLLVDGDIDCQKRVEAVRLSIEKELGTTIRILDGSLKSQINSLPLARPPDDLRKDVRSLSPASVIFTSGTTGLPKGMNFTMARMHTSAINIERFPGNCPGTDGDIWYMPMPLYHGTGTYFSMCCILSGTTLAIGDGFSVSKFWQDIRESQATGFIYVGETARYLLAAPPSALDKAHKVRIMHGNGLRPDVWQRFQERFGVTEVLEFYNSSEGPFGTAIWARGPFLQDCIGHYGLLARYLTRDLAVLVEVDYETDELIRDHKTGFLKRQSYQLGGELLVRLNADTDFAYWDNAKATEKKLVRNAFSADDVYFRTGDAMRRDSEGKWYFLDRLGDTYRWKGENVSTAEVAQVIGSFPTVHEAIVYGVQIPGHDGRAGCAALSISPDRRKDFDRLGTTRLRL